MSITFTLGEFVGYILLSFMVRFSISYWIGKKDDTFDDYTSTAFCAILLRVLWLFLV